MIGTHQQKANQKSGHASLPRTHYGNPFISRDLEKYGRDLALRILRSEL